MTGPQFDLVVVGGGPVGIYAASRASLRGMRVTVIEPRDLPIDKACGEGLMPSALESLGRIEIDPPGQPFTGITYLDADGTRSGTATFETGPGRGVRRTALSETLGIRAKELHVELVHDRCVGIDQASDSVAVLLEGGQSITSRYVFGADGLHSKVRGWVGISTRGRRPARYGLRKHFHTAPWSDTVEVYWSQHAEAYVTPVSATEVGVAILSGATEGSFEDRLGQFPALRERLGSATASSQVRGAGPLWQRVSRRTTGRVLLIGDAAGYVDALTGEGLAMGFRCADAALHAVALGEPGTYEREWRRLTRHYRWLTRGLVDVTRSQAIRRRIAPAADTAHPVFAALVNQLG